MLKQSEEDYIKYIFEQNQNADSEVTIKEIAQYFSYTDQSVHEMVKKLEKKKYLNYQPYKGLRLTKKGNEEAIRMIRAHRLWERFLGDYLGYAWDEVHEEAEKLEHASSDRLLKKLYERLGKPTHCQHGNPIPNFENSLTKTFDTPLVNFNKGDTFVLKRIQDHKPLLKHLSQVGIQLNDSLYIFENDPFLELIHIRKENLEPIPMSYKIAGMMFG